MDRTVPWAENMALMDASVVSLGRLRTKSLFMNEVLRVFGAGKNKPRAGRGLFNVSGYGYVGSLWAFGAVFDVEVHGLAFSQNL